MTIRAAAYARFSSDNQRIESIDAQLRAIKDYCTDNQYMLVQTYQDEAISGTSDHRDAFLEMIAAAKKGLFDVVIVHKLDRFARNRYDSAIYRKELADHNVKLISVLENIDEDNPENIILLSVLEGMNEYYSKNLAREVRKGQKENALKGIHNGGIPPLGFDVDPETRKLVINPIESEAVRLIFELYTKQYGYDTISKILNDRGYKTKLNKPFTKNSIAEIIRNEKYIGHYVFNKRLSKKSGNRKYKDEKDIVKIENCFPAIVDLETWNKKEDILKSRVRPRKASCNRHFLLTGKITCKCCNGDYTGSSTYSGRNKTKYFQYESSNRKRKLKGCKNKPIRAEYLEDFVINKLKTEILVNIDDLANTMLTVIQEIAKDNNKNLAVLIQKRDALQERINKLLDLLLDGVITKQALESKSSKMQQDLDELMIKINDLETNQLRAPSKENIKKYLRNMQEALENEDADFKQLVIDTFVDKIIIGEDDIEIIFIVSPLAVNRNNHIYTLQNLDAYKVDGDGTQLTIDASVNKADLIPKYKPINKD